MIEFLIEYRDAIHAGLLLTLLACCFAVWWCLPHSEDF